MTDARVGRRIAIASVLVSAALAVGKVLIGWMAGTSPAMTKERVEIS